MKKTFFSIAMSAILALSFFFVACNRNTKEIQPNSTASKQNVRKDKSVNQALAQQLASNTEFQEAMSILRTMSSQMQSHVATLSEAQKANILQNMPNPVTDQFLVSAVNYDLSAYIAERIQILNKTLNACNSISGFELLSSEDYEDTIAEARRSFWSNFYPCLGKSFDQYNVINREIAAGRIDESERQGYYESMAKDFIKCLFS